MSGSEGLRQSHRVEGSSTSSTASREARAAGGAPTSSSSSQQQQQHLHHLGGAQETDSAQQQQQQWFAAPGTSNRMSSVSNLFPPSSAGLQSNAASLPHGIWLQRSMPSYPGSAVPRPPVLSMPPLSPQFPQGFFTQSPMVISPASLGQLPIAGSRSGVQPGAPPGNFLFGMGHHGGFVTPTAQPHATANSFWYGQAPPQSATPARPAPVISPQNSMQQMVIGRTVIEGTKKQDEPVVRDSGYPVLKRSSIVKRTSSSSVEGGMDPRSRASFKSNSSISEVDAAASSNSIISLLNPDRDEENRKRLRGLHEESVASAEGASTELRESADSDTLAQDFNGEGRLAIDFVSEGALTILPPPLIGRRSVVPDGLSGYFTSYGERWQFLVRYAEIHQITISQGKRQLVAVEWLIRNSAWDSYVSLVETAKDALRREDRGVTLCNRAFTMALAKRAHEYELLLAEEQSKPNPNHLRVANLTSRIKTLRPRRTSEGPLLFGLRHKSVQDRFIDSIRSTFPETLTRIQRHESSASNASVSTEHAVSSLSQFLQQSSASIAESSTGAKKAPEEPKEQPKASSGGSEEKAAATSEEVQAIATSSSSATTGEESAKGMT